MMTSPSRDINELFDDIVLTEEKEARLGYEEGLKDGQEQGNEEGYKLGYAQGVSLGEELGRIFGQVVAQQQLQHTDKVRRSLQQIRSLIEEFPRTNDPQADIVGAVQEIRSSQRRLRALLGSKKTSVATLSEPSAVEHKHYSF
ncbi:LTO1 family protein C191.08 [Drosophila eugracilis]|uniref:LTO1 family protein C191.08 n=1 Tax=Drosophila eugracilis TaxID=29029 RepID=UPI0007E631A3|nr:LTO1 family protein C191.08 [Drosophila eugracilis]